MVLLKYVYWIQYYSWKGFWKIFSTFDAGKMINAKELLAHRTTVTNPIRINLFYCSTYRYFILDKPRYRHFLFYREKLHSLRQNITSFPIIVDLWKLVKFCILNNWIFLFQSRSRWSGLVPHMSNSVSKNYSDISTCKNWTTNFSLVDIYF